MRLENIQGIHIGGRDVTEVKLGGKVIWPLNVVTYDCVGRVKYFSNSGESLGVNNGAIPANGQGYVLCYLVITPKVYGVPIGGEHEIAASVSQYGSNGVQGQTWTISSNRITVTSRGANEDSANTMQEFDFSCTFDNKPFQWRFVPIYQQQNQKTLGTKTTALQEIFLSTNKYGSTGNACAASGSGQYDYATISCEGIYKDTTPVTYTSGANGTPIEETRTGVYISPGNVTFIINNGYLVRYGSESLARFRFNSLGTTIATEGVTSVITASHSGKVKTIALYQAPNLATITYGSPTASISANEFTSSSSPCGAGGGSTLISVSNATRTKTTTFTSGATPIVENVNIDVTISSSGSGLSYYANSGLATWGDRTNITGNARSGSIRVYFGDTFLDSVTLYQQKNEETGSTTTYSLSSAISITASGTPTRASGGSSSSNYWTIGSNSVIRSVKKTYTSNYNAPATTTNMGAPTYSTSSSGLNVSGTKVWWDNMGATPYNYGRSGSFVAKYNGSQVGDAKSVEQSSNTVESYSYEVFLTIDSNTSNFTISNAEHQLTYDAYQLKTPTYTSGAQGSVVRESRTPTSSNSGVFIVQGGLIRVGANTYTSTRYSIITVRSTDNSASKSITITQEAKTYVLRFSPTSYYVPYNATQLAVGIVADINWTLNVNNAIVSGNTSGSGSRDAVLEVNRNLGGQRSATIQVQGTGSQSNLSAIAQVTQGAYEGQWIGAVDKKSHTVTFGAGSEGLTMIVPMHTNGIARKTSETGNTGWYTLLMNIPTSGEDYRITITCNEPASTGFDREATIVWTANNEQLTLYIRQTPN